MIPSIKCFSQPNLDEQYFPDANEAFHEQFLLPFDAPTLALTIDSVEDSDGDYHLQHIP
jgi:hypothetical protein